jgi:ADP-heptose:LPS heptosyltransferase
VRLKRLEKAWRSFAIRLIGRLMGEGERGGPPDWDARPHRVLFLRHDRIGDMILSTGVLRAIAASHPNITLDVLTSPANAPVLSAEPHVASVVVFEKGKPWKYPAFARQLRRARYDAVIDCMVTAPSLTTLLLMLASGARHRIGVEGRGNDFSVTLPVAPLPSATHLVEHLASLATAFGVDPYATDWQPSVTLTDVERATADRVWRSAGGAPGGPRLLVNVSAGKTFRHWPDDRFIAVLRHARARVPGINVLVIGSPAEWERATRIAREADARAERTPGIRNALALVATADLVFTPDTSIGHAASAFRKPAVVMHIRGTLPRWGLYGTRGHSLSSPDTSLASLPLEPVLAALDDLLQTAGASRSGTA